MALMCRYQQRWAEVSAITCSRSLRTRHERRGGTPVTEVGEWGRFLGAPVAPGFPWRVRRVEADIVVVHVPNPTAELGCLIAPPRGPVVVRYHSDVVRQARAIRLYRPFLMKFLRKAAMILPTSRQYLESSDALAPVREQCRVVPLGIEPEVFAAPDPARVAELRQAYGQGYVLFSGRHRYYKGLEHLVRAALRIHAPVVIAGDGPERANCRALARNLGVEIHFPGELSHDDLVAHLHGCAVFAFPSVARSEAFGISILEAHACGKAVVATKLGTGVEFANLDGETGLNVEPANPGAFADAVNELLDDADRRDAMGAWARERVTREFTAEAVAKAEYALYQEVMECSRTRT